jgi:hypothetical protein
MNKWIKISVLSISVLIIGIGLMAFRPYGDPPTGDGAVDHTSALAEALGISVEELEAALQVVNTKMIDQAVADGVLTQVQADKILAGEPPAGNRRMKSSGRFFRGEDFNTLLAEELGIDFETLHSAQQEVQNALLAQALEDGRISQEEFDMMQIRRKMSPYFQDAFSLAHQAAVDAALEDGAITQEQANLLMENGQQFAPGFRKPGNSHRPGKHLPFHGPMDSSGDN